MAVDGYTPVVAKDEQESFELFDDGDVVGIYELVDTATVVLDKHLVVNPKRGRPRKNGKH